MKFDEAIWFQMSWDIFCCQGSPTNAKKCVARLVIRFIYFISNFMPVRYFQCIFSSGAPQNLQPFWAVYQSTSNHLLVNPASTNNVWTYHQDPISTDPYSTHITSCWLLANCLLFNFQTGIFPIRIHFVDFALLIFCCNF